MTPEDRKLARKLMISNRLTIEQVTQLKEECEATGRPFGRLVVERGYLRESEAPRPKPRPPGAGHVFAWLLGGSAVVLVGLLIVSAFFIKAEWGEDEDAAAEASRFRAETERKAIQVRQAYARKRAAEREDRARMAVMKARQIMAFVEERVKEAPAEPDVYLRLVEATIEFNTYLEVHTGAALVYVERSRAWELRRDYARAISDLEKAMALKKSIEPDVRNQIQELRIRLVRPNR